MIKKTNKYKLAFITSMLDFLIIYIITNEELNEFDRNFANMVLLLHLLFFISLKNNYKGLLYLLHVLVFLFLFISIYISNKDLLSVCILLTIIIQILWILEGKCILNEEGEESGYGNKFSLIFIILTVALSVKLGTLYCI